MDWNDAILITSGLEFLGHFVVSLLGFLDLLRHGALLLLGLLQQLARLLDLVVNERHSVYEGASDFLLGLVDQDSADLLENLRVCVPTGVPSAKMSISLRTRLFSLSCS